MKNTDNAACAARAAAGSLLCNLALAALKLAAGVLGGSAALISDAAHSLTDVFGSLIAVFGIRLSSKAPDSGHPCGHGRIESVFALAMSLLLTATGIGIGIGGVTGLISGAYSEPGIVALAAAAFCAAVKELAFRFTRRAAVRAFSGSLMAEAWHHRADALASCGGFIGVLGARLGFPALDCAACLVICALVLRAALGILADSVKRLTDAACDEATREQLLRAASEQDGVLAVDSLRARLAGGGVHVDVEIRVNGSWAVVDGHETAHRVCDALLRQAGVSHCTVHVNPAPVALNAEGAAEIRVFGIPGSVD